MRDDEFEWDDRKAARNLREHGVAFDTARAAFDDPFQRWLDDDRRDYGEDRHVMLGLVSDLLLCAAYTYRSDRIRIISAREAEPYEHRLYHEAQR